MRNTCFTAYHDLESRREVLADDLDVRMEDAIAGAKNANFIRLYGNAWKNCPRTTVKPFNWLLSRICIIRKLADVPGLSLLHDRRC